MIRAAAAAGTESAVAHTMDFAADRRDSLNETRPVPLANLAKRIVEHSPPHGGPMRQNSISMLPVLAALAGVTLSLIGCPGPRLRLPLDPGDPTTPTDPLSPRPGALGSFLDPRLAEAPFTSTVTRPALSGGTLLVTGELAVVGDPDRDRLVVVDLIAGRVVGETALAPGSEPGRMAIDASGRVHSALRGGGVYSFMPRAVSAGVRHEACAMPRGIAYDAEADLMRVACRSGELLALSPETGEIVESVLVGRDLRDVVVVGK